MNATVKETIESLQNLIRELRKYPEDATVDGMHYTEGLWDNLDLTDWKIGDVTENPVDVLF